MRILRKIISMMLIISVLSIGIGGSAFAESGGSMQDGAFNTGLYPKEKTDKNSKHLFDRYDISNYDLTYISNADEVGVKKCDDGLIDFKCGLASAAYSIAELVWWLYAVVAKWIVSIISWAFSMEVLKYMLNAYTDALNGLQKTLWEPFMYLMWAVAVAWMVYYWISGKTTRLWSTLLNSLIIIALSVTFMNSLPKFLQTLSDTSTQTSVFILTGLNDTQKGNSIGTTSEDSALDQFKDNLFSFAIVLPYKLAQFGSPTLANKKIDKYDGKPFWEAMASQDDRSKRDDVIRDFYDAEKDKDNVKEDYAWFTYEKAWSRVGFTLITFVGALIALTCFLMVAFYTIMWQLIALGRGLLAAIYLLISLWPEYGMKEAAQWIWSMVQAMFMKVFYTIILAVYINMIISLANNVGKKDGDDIGIMTIWLLALAIFLGLNQALKELRQKLTYIPLGNGMSLQGATNEGEELGNKTAGAALMAAGAMTGIGGLAAAGMTIRDGGIGGVVSGMTMGAARMVNKGVKSGLKAGWKVTKWAGNKVDDKYFGGRIKKTAERVKGAISRENLRAIRTSGRLSKEDRELIKQARDVDGLDLTTQEGRDAFLEKHPEHAEAIGRLNDRFTSYAMMKKGMPKVIPPKNSEKYEQLVRKYGEQNVEAFREAKRQTKETRKNLPLKERVKPPSDGKHAKNPSLKVTYDKIREAKAATPSFGVTVDTVANAKSIPSSAKKVVLDSIKTQIPSNITTEKLDIDWKDLQKQIQDAAKKVNTGTGGRGQLQKITISVNRKDESGKRTNNKETIKVDLKSLQQSWVSKNPVVANTQLQGQIIQWARGLNMSAGGGGRADTTRVVKSFKGHFDMGIQHLAKGGKIEDLNLSRLETLMPELKGLDNMQKLDRVERSIGITPPSGSTEIQRMEMVSRALGQNLSTIPTPK